MGFTVDVDVANRALQHCGQPRIDATLGFSEGTQRAQEIQFAYGKIKRAELRDNPWRFATRRTPLRAIDTNTMVLAPALWGSTFTYFKGSVASDSTGFLWQSKVPSNLNNQPGQPGAIFAWEPYFGPLTAALYDSTQTYFAGEVVYTAPGDGTYNVYISLLSGNALDPSLRNVWNALNTYFQNQVVIVYPVWASGTTYAAGATVTYTDGNTYSSLAAGNVGNAPSVNSTKWALTPILSLMSITPTTSAPTTSPVIEYASGTVYSIGNFVNFAGKEYVSLANSNTGNQPNLAASSSFWAQLTGGTLYMSLIDLNANNNPANAPALWAIGTTYATGNQVGGSDGVIYTSLSNGNVGNDPTIDGGVHWQNTGVLNPWTTVFTQGAGNQQWLQIGGAAFPGGVALTALDIVYPLGSGPSSQSTTRNVFRLPAGFMREAPQAPKAGSLSYLGVPGNLMATDWTYEGNYFTSAYTDVIPYRFIADVVDVTSFDDMFCEAFAARLGAAVCPTLTQSSAKVQEITAEYDRWVFKAKRVNGIETGPVQPALDDYLACRA